MKNRIKTKTNAQGKFVKLLIVCFISFSQIQAQDLKSKFTYYRDLAVAYQNTNPDSATVYTDSCLVTARGMEDQYYLGIAFQMKGRDFFMRSDADSALYYEKNACQIFQFYPDSTAHYTSQYNLGNIYLYMEEHIQALVQFKKVLRIIDENFNAYTTEGDAKINLNRAYCYVSIGLVYDYMGIILQSWKTCKRA
ncbi:MAG: hypothetical protein IPG07_19500 [Crocinitomicaceae bacterium]|nr:hypothetical protein [Crocinitomicaceae bacterium]